MNNLPRWGSIKNLYAFDKDKYEGIWGVQRVVVSEKLHGTNSVIYIFPEKVIVGGRKRTYGPGEGIKDQYEITHTIGERVRQTMLADNKFPDCGRVTIFGEFAGPKVQKGIKYSDKRDFWGFGMLIGESYWADILEAEDFCEHYDIKFVPILYVGPPDMEVFDALYDKDSHVLDIENNTMEGIVITSYPLVFDRFGAMIRAKHKNEKWNERKVEARPIQDKDEFAFVCTYLNNIRILHAVDRLKEENTWVGGMEDMRNLIQIVMEDLKTEPAFEGLNERAVRKIASKTVARMYKEMLRTRTLL